MLHRPRTAFTHAAGRPGTSSTGSRPGTAGLFARPTSSGLSTRPGTSSRPNSNSVAAASATGLFWKKNRIGSADDARDLAPSELTLGGDTAFGGNLAKALRQRREGIPEPVLPGDSPLDTSSLLDEIRAWKAQEAAAAAQQGVANGLGHDWGFGAAGDPQPSRIPPTAAAAYQQQHWGEVSAVAEEPAGSGASSLRSSAFYEDNEEYTESSNANVLTIRPESNAILAPGRIRSSRARAAAATAVEALPPRPPAGAPPPVAAMAGLGLGGEEDEDGEGSGSFGGSGATTPELHGSQPPVRAVNPLVAAAARHSMAPQPPAAGDGVRRAMSSGGRPASAASFGGGAAPRPSSAAVAPEAASAGFRRVIPEHLTSSGEVLGLDSTGSTPRTPGIEMGVPGAAGLMPRPTAATASGRLAGI